MMEKREPGPVGEALPGQSLSLFPGPLLLPPAPGGRLKPGVVTASQFSHRTVRCRDRYV